MPRYRFVNWTDETGAPVGDTPAITLLIDKDKTLTAHYEEVVVPTHTLTISATPGGTTDPAPGSYEYDEGTVARVTAIPDSGYLFDHWELDSITRTENPIEITMDRDYTLHAIFAELPPPKHTLTISSTTGGTTDPAPGSYEYDEGTTARVTAIPDSGFKFYHWELDGATRTENPIDVFMDRDHTLHAVFAELPPPEHLLTISATEGGTTDPAPGSYYYPEGTVAMVVAYPDKGYIFDHWLIDEVTRETANPVNILMDKDHTLHAVFKEAPPVPPPSAVKMLALLGGAAAVMGLAYYAGK